MSKLLLSPAAERDLVQRFEYLREKNPQAARAFRRRLQEVLRALAAGDFEGRLVTLTDGTEVRRWPVLDRIIYYQHQESVLWIVRIYPAHSDPLEG